MEANYRQMVAQLAEKERDLTTVSRKGDRGASEVKALRRKLLVAETKVAAQNKEREELKGEVSALNRQLRDQKAKSKELQNLSKKRNLDQRNKDIRLNRALEDAEKWKRELLKHRSEDKSSVTMKNGKIDRLADENRKLRQQKNQLISAFRKQAKLIDVLKRQKLHMEAMKMLEFTEKEFMRIIDSGSQSNVKY